MNQRWRNAGLYGLFAIVTIALSTAVFAEQPQTRETWEYSQFIQEVEKDNVNKVSLTSDRTRILAQSEDGKRFLVNLPDDPELINTLVQNQVDISIVLELKDSDF